MLIGFFVRIIPDIYIRQKAVSLDLCFCVMYVWEEMYCILGDFFNGIFGQMHSSL